MKIKCITSSLVHVNIPKGKIFSSKKNIWNNYKNKLKIKAKQEDNTIRKLSLDKSDFELIDDNNIIKIINLI